MKPLTPKGEICKFHKDKRSRIPMQSHVTVVLGWYRHCHAGTTCMDSCCVGSTVDHLRGRIYGLRSFTDTVMCSWTPAMWGITWSHEHCT